MELPKIEYMVPVCPGCGRHEEHGWKLWVRCAARLFQIDAGGGKAEAESVATRLSGELQAASEEKWPDILRRYAGRDVFDDADGKGWQMRQRA